MTEREKNEIRIKALEEAVKASTKPYHVQLVEDKIERDIQNTIGNRIAISLLRAIVFCILFVGGCHFLKK